MLANETSCVRAIRLDGRVSSGAELFSRGEVQ